MERKVSPIINRDMNSVHDGVDIHVSAPGKVILHGEHSVVYGKLAIAASLGLRTHLYLSQEYINAATVLQIDFEDFGFFISNPIIPLIKELHHDSNKYTPQHFPYEQQMTLINAFVDDKFPKTEIPEEMEEIEYFGMRTAFAAFLLLYMAIISRSGIPLETMKIVVKSDIRVGSGMGSSASFVVCIVAAFAAYLKQYYRAHPQYIVDELKMFANTDETCAKTFTPDELQFISDWALVGERVMHGNPSGIDTTLATFGSLIEFRKGTQHKMLSMSTGIQAVLVNSNVAKDTGKMIKKVVKLKEKFPEIVQNTFESMELVAKSSIECLIKLNHLDEMNNENIKEINHCYSTMNTLFGMNQNLLRILDVSHEAIENICSILSTFGLNGKITGAGGGGFVICLLPKKLDQAKVSEIVERLTSDKYECFTLELGGPGVTCH